MRRERSDDVENGKTHLIRMISTAWRKSSQVLYSSGSSCNGMMRECGEQDGHGTAAHVEGIVFSHLTHELSADPRSHIWPTVLIEPPESLHRPDDPSPLALLGQHVSKPGVVRGTPEREIEKKEDLARRARQGVKEDELEREQAEVDNVDVRFWIGRVEEGCDDIVRGRDAENWEVRA